MSCEIFLDSSGPFYSGKNISGKLVCTFNKSKKIRGIKLRVYGKEHTEWTETVTQTTSDDKTETVYITYTGNNQIFHSETIFFGNIDSTSHIGPGKFEYPFDIALPSDIPSTFENRNGYIKYSIKGLVDIPWASDYQEKLNIVVSSLIDLNKLPIEYFKMITDTDVNRTCNFCFSGGEIITKITMFKSAYVPGENVKMFIDVSNMSKTTVESITVKLRQFIKSIVTHPGVQTDTMKKLLGQSRKSGVGAHGRNNYKIEIPIPTDFQVPNFANCELFEVSHVIDVKVHTGDCHTNSHISFDICIGHVQRDNPIGFSTSVFDSFESLLLLPTAPVGSIANTLPSAPELDTVDPPPVYDSVITVIEDNKGSIGESSGHTRDSGLPSYEEARNQNG